MDCYEDWLLLRTSLELFICIKNQLEHKSDSHIYHNSINKGGWRKPEGNLNTLAITWGEMPFLGYDEVVILSF